MRIFSFDAEANGLHGPILSVGACVLDTGVQGMPRQRVRETFYMARDCRGWRLDPWVKEHVIPAMSAEQHIGFAKSDREIRDRFWPWMLDHKARGCVIVADCPWPVEGSFLSQCVADDPAVRAFQGPYPLLDVATLLYAAGMNPVGEYGKELWPGHTPHNPLHDAIVSALCVEMALLKMGRL